MIWKLEEEETLKHLRENEGVKCWEKIALFLNQRLNVSKTGRQCREKYVNHTKFGEVSNEKNNWSSVEENTLKNMYIQWGSSWSTFLSHFPNKYSEKEQRSEVSMKNLFYNKLHKFSRKLSDYERSTFKESRTFIMYGTLITILELNQSIKKWIRENSWRCSGINIVEENALIMLEMVFNTEKETSNQELYDYVMDTKKLTTKLRSLGIFKLKNKKIWKLTPERMKFIFREKNLKNEEKEEEKTTQESFSEISDEVSKNFRLKPTFIQESNADIESLNLEDFEPFFLSNQKQSENESLLSFLKFNEEMDFHSYEHF